MPRIVLATRNQGKVLELEQLFDEPRIQLVSVKDVLPDNFEVDETGSTFEENAWLKAEAVAAASGLPALADDSGIEVDALGQRPGVHSARFAGYPSNDSANNALLLRELEDVPRAQRTGRFVCVLAFALPALQLAHRRVACARGVIEGHILTAPRGCAGFGYDPLFEPLEMPGRTTAELLPEEKNRISHRGRAARTLRSSLLAWLDSSAEKPQ